MRGLREAMFMAWNVTLAIIDILQSTAPSTGTVLCDLYCSDICEPIVPNVLLLFRQSGIL